MTNDISKIPISHGSGQMRAQSISIQVSTRERCNAGCLFCISRTTPGTKPQEGIRDIHVCDTRRLRIGLNYARQLGATHAVLTSRADPTQEDADYMRGLVSTCREYLPLVDMHTNGFLLLPDKPKHRILHDLIDDGLTMITFSIASFDPDVNRSLMIIREGAQRLIETVRDLGLLVRCSLVVNRNGVQNFDGVMDYIRKAGELGAHMVVVREVWVPPVYGEFHRDVYDWNGENWIDIKPIQDTFEEVASQSDNVYGLRELNPLPWGTPVFVVGGVFSDQQHGVNVTFARCEEATIGSVLKSIVHRDIVNSCG